MESNNKRMLLSLLIFAGFPTIVNADVDGDTLNATNYSGVKTYNSNSHDNNSNSEPKTNVITEAGLSYDKDRVKARKDALTKGEDLPSFPNDYDKQIKEKYNRENEEAKKKAQEEYERQKREEEKRKQESNMDVTKPLVNSNYYPKVPI